MAVYTRSLEELIKQFKKLPGIGPRSAERIALYVLNLPESETKAFAQAMIRVKEQVKNCNQCGNFSEEAVCSICSDTQRDAQTLCVVEAPKDIPAFEKSGSYKGVYHVLMGSLSPLDGIGPEQLKIGKLVQRVRSGNFKEIILATDADAEGDATALYLIQELKPLGVEVSRIAQGIPLGRDVEWADEATLQRAMEHRHTVSS